jgi:hypothetical protein
MLKKIKGAIETQVYTAEGGYVAIKQSAPVGDADQVCKLTADQLPELVRELQALYDARATWEEAAAE